jgi:hypothetical protein
MKEFYKGFIEGLRMFDFDRKINWYEIGVAIGMSGLLGFGIVISTIIVFIVMAVLRYVL